MNEYHRLFLGISMFAIGKIAPGTGWFRSCRLERNFHRRLAGERGAI